MYSLCLHQIGRFRIYPFEQTSNHSYLFYPHASSASPLVTSVSLSQKQISAPIRNPNAKLYSSALLSLDQSTSERLRALETLKLSNGEI
jgi:hypothetical protein